MRVAGAVGHQVPKQPVEESWLGHAVDRIQPEAGGLELVEPTGLRFVRARRLRARAHVLA